MYKEFKGIFSLGLAFTMVFAMTGFKSVVSAQTVSSSEVTTTGRVTRISGINRFVTAATVATTPEGSTSKDVILVSGGNYADAISATTLAKELNAPILLTNQGEQTLNPDTKAALDKLKPGNVYIIGGIGVITSAVQVELQSYGYATPRLGGANRYATNVLVADELLALGVTATNVMMVGGENFPDALSVAPIAANKDEILLLANTNITSSKVTVDFANSHNSNVIILGSKDMVSNDVQATINKSTRIDGEKTRYETNEIISNKFAPDLKFDKIYLASGQDFPDALVASPLAGAASGPLVLVDTKVGDSTYKLSTDFAVSYLKANISDASKIYFIGGPTVISDALITTINSAVLPAVNILSPAGPYIEAYNVIVNWEEIPGSTYYDIEVFDLTNKQEIANMHVTNGTSFQIGNEDYEKGPDGSYEWTSYLKENHQIRITVDANPTGKQIISKTRIVTVNSFKAKPITVTYPKQDTVLSTSDIQKYQTFVISGPDRPLDYYIAIYDLTDNKSVVTQETREKIITLPPNTLIAGHNYLISVNCWMSIVDSLSQKPSLFDSVNNFSVASN